MSRRHLGSWQCPSGNTADAFVEVDGALHHLRFEWDSFPLSREDEAHYAVVIRPAAIARAREMLELVGRTLVVQL